MILHTPCLRMRATYQVTQCSKTTWCVVLHLILPKCLRLFQSSESSGASPLVYDAPWLLSRLLHVSCLIFSALSARENAELLCDISGALAFGIIACVHAAAIFLMFHGPVGGVTDGGRFRGEYPTWEALRFPELH